MTESLRLKEKMAGLTSKWKGKDPMKGSNDYMQMRLDRMVYRSLKRKLDKIELRINPQIKTARSIFKV
jgi:hypothetical protein